MDWGPPGSLLLPIPGCHNPAFLPLSAPVFLLRNGHSIPRNGIPAAEVSIAKE